MRGDEGGGLIEERTVLVLERMPELVRDRLGLHRGPEGDLGLADAQVLARRGPHARRRVL